MELVPWLFILLRFVAVIAAVAFVIVLLWRSARAQEETARRLAAIETLLAECG